MSRFFCFSVEGVIMSKVSADRILVIDDEQAVLDVIQKFLTTIGIYQIDGCTSYNCFTDFFRPGKYDMVIVDINLSPNQTLSGLDIIRQIKEMDRNTLIVVITGYPESLINEQLVSLEIDDFLLKPLTLDAFAYRIILDLARHKRHRAFNAEIQNKYGERIEQLKCQAEEISRRLSDLFLGERHGREERDGDNTAACAGIS